MERDALYQIKLLQNDITRKSFHPMEGCPNIPKGPVQFLILDFLIGNRSKPVYQKDLEEITNIRKSTLSGILDTMEKNGIIERIPSSKDARKKLIVLSEEAERHHQKMKRYFKRISKDIVKDISKENLTVFFEVIEIMRKNINEVEGEKFDD